MNFRIGFKYLENELSPEKDCIEFLSQRRLQQSKETFLKNLKNHLIDFCIFNNCFLIIEDDHYIIYTNSAKIYI